MVQKVLTELIDDLGGGPAVETVRFGLGRHEYEIDLNNRNAKGLRKMVEGYARCGRKTGPVRGGGRPAAGRRRAAAIRAWAVQQGYEPGERGRIPVKIVDAYEHVHGA